MSHKFLSDTNFHLILTRIDHDLAKGVQQKRCSCGGKLHQSNYPRSPAGLPAAFRDSYSTRISFCCDRCRKRTTPPTVRFFGRRWFPAPLFVLISALMTGINERRLEQVKRYFGITVSESTWKRWRKWWRESFAVTCFWQHAKGLALRVTETKGIFPRALFVLFSGTLEEKFRLLLRFLSPLTGGNLRAV